MKHRHRKRRRRRTPRPADAALVRIGALGRSKSGTRIKMADGFYRFRRGRLVRIPDEWAGVVTSPQRIRQRQSKDSHKAATALDPCGYGRKCKCPRHNRIPKERQKLRPNRKPSGWWTGPGHPSTFAPRKVGGRFDRMQRDRYDLDVAMTDDEYHDQLAETERLRIGRTKTIQARRQVAMRRLGAEGGNDWRPSVGDYDGDYDGDDDDHLLLGVGDDWADDPYDYDY